ncbi:MAG: LysM peptidoglycan-binding domain-containing protein, partial [Anaerolineae bacterium]
MIDLSSGGRRRRGSHGARIALAAALVLLALMIWQPWRKGFAPEFALVPAFNPTGTPAPTPTPLTPTAAPIPSPTVSPSPTAVPTAVSGVVTYTVAAGDTLSGLAKRFGVPLHALLETNALEEDAVLRVGQVLTIPAAEAAPAPAGNMEVYEVQAGDTLSGIAARFGVPIGDIMKANDIEDPELLQIGQVLHIPLAPPTPTSTPTLRPTPTPTPGPPLPAPVPLRPADGTDLGEARYVLLNWTAVRLLGED